MDSQGTYSAVITGDVIDSRSFDDSMWILPMKELLSELGKQGDFWDLYRGDGFQIHLTNPEKAFELAIRIRALLKSKHKKLDARMAIGIAKVDPRTRSVKESTGDAFVYSGQLLEQLEQQGETFSVRTQWRNFDQLFNVILKFCAVTIDSWSISSAKVVDALWMTDRTQAQVAELLRISQSAVSRAQARAHLELFEEVNSVFKRQVEHYGNL